MRKPCLLAAIGVAALSVPAFAQDATGNVEVTGTVARLCILGEPSRSVVDLGQMVATSGAGVGRIAPVPAQNVTLPGSFCNFAGSVVGITASALVEASGTLPPAGFARAVNYTATASGWATSDAAATSAASADGANPDTSGVGGNQPEPQLADIAVQLSDFTVPANALLLAGNYGGLVTVTLGPVPIAE